MTITRLEVSAASSESSRLTTASPLKVGVGASGSTIIPFGAALLTSAMTALQKRWGSRSSRSTATHAGGSFCSRLCNQDRTSRVLPLPADAVTTDTGARAPVSNSSMSAGRDTSRVEVALSIAEQRYPRSWRAADSDHAFRAMQTHLRRLQDGARWICPRTYPQSEEDTMSVTEQPGTTYTSGYGRRPSVTDTEGFDRGTGTGGAESAGRVQPAADEARRRRFQHPGLGRLPRHAAPSRRVRAPDRCSRDQRARAAPCGHGDVDRCVSRTCGSTTIPTTSSSDRASGRWRSAS